MSLQFANPTELVIYRCSLSHATNVFSTISAMEQSQPLVSAFPSSGGDRTTEDPEPARMRPGAKAPAIATQDLSDNTRTDHTQFSSQPGNVELGSRRHLQSSTSIWGKSWTAETCSFIISILALAGLTATLLVHQNKPLPQWPQLVTINSIISLFSLLMRACVGVVLAEGMGHPLITGTYFDIV